MSVLPVHVHGKIGRFIIFTHKQSLFAWPIQNIRVSLASNFKGEGEVCWFLWFYRIIYSLIS